ncbi:hypothetical protein MSTE_02001 [Mycobacteroides stephanolepidis]|uniref:N-acetyltransferase domain-containing protein n=1 Tax=[Mycobacterium] stephanolepidis TaxID=1520670 RepID=A0A1Z4EWK3_9MYCO|nr:GNAT family N-acetyltransferase [[Mycobacterium] stephanolepidis]BAX97317.1 hypothetical protein MSTE_02001 [[Mycobacterium] stephanolepidis]
MKREISIVDASAEEISNLDYWYALSGGRMGDAKDIEDLLKAKDAGVLGCAIGGALSENMERMLFMPRENWYYARTAIKSLRINGQTAGMLVMGAHAWLWDQLTDRKDADWESGTAPELWPDWAKAFYTSVMCTAKLHVVAISPDHHRQGLGSRLVKRALKIAERGNTVMLYGQFDSAREGLGKFYGGHGFKVLDEGQPLHMLMATGDPKDYSVPPPGDAYFVKYWQRR